MKRHLIIPFFGSLISATTLHAQSSELPTFDTKAYCKGVSATIGGSAQIELTCRQMEKTSKDGMATVEIPESVMSYCSQTAQVVGGSYQIFAVCVEQELAALKQLEQ